jgi:Holliday junction DNA helicase RuvB
MAQNDDRALRPLSFDDFSGQDAARRNLRVFVRAAIARGEPLDHVLFTGPPGTGKTTLAGIVAAEMGSRLVTVNCPSIKTKGDLVGTIISLERGDILFLDEVHRLRPELEELLYTVMEDSRIDIVGSAGVVSVDLPKFTVIGATTKSGMLSRPFLDRFGEVCNLELYDAGLLSKVVERSAGLLGVQCSTDACLEIAKRARGTPRIALRILRRVRDFAECDGIVSVDAPFAAAVAETLGIDRGGLDKQSRAMLTMLAAKNRPVGLSAVAASLGESKETVEESLEPYLMLAGLIERLPTGRVVTPAGKRYLQEA